MKRAFKILFTLTFLFALLVLPGHVALAALTKTTSIIESDAWSQVNAGGFQLGSPTDIFDSYRTIVYLEIAYIDTDAQDGVWVIIEVSYGDDNWMLLYTFQTPSGGALTSSTLYGSATAGETTIDLNEGSYFATPGQQWFIYDGTDGEYSESVRTKSESGDTVTLCHDLIRSHVSDSVVWETVHNYALSIPPAYAYVRVLINNADSNADIIRTIRISKVTEL